MDYDQNMEWLHKMARGMPADCRLDACIVAGDVSHDLRVIRKALSVLKETFNSVYFVPGNHELWMKKDAEANGDASDSFEKLEKIEQLCEELDVLTRPAPFHGVWIAPLQSWHHQDWDTEPDIPNIPAVETRSSDYAPADIILGPKAARADFYALSVRRMRNVVLLKNGAREV